MGQPEDSARTGQTLPAKAWGSLPEGSVLQPRPQGSTLRPRAPLTWKGSQGLWVCGQYPSHSAFSDMLLLRAEPCVETSQPWSTHIILFFFYKFIYLFIFGCVGSLLLCAGFL